MRGETRFWTTPCTRVTESTYTEAAARRVLGTYNREVRWPYGPNVCGVTRNAFMAWALAEDLRQPPRTHRGCFSWLTGQRASRDQDRRDRRDQFLSNPLDHLTLWRRYGKRALVLAQPYGPPTPEWIVATEAAWPVRVQVTERAPWYGYGTFGVLITPAGSP